jgi:hypothetical protein
VPPQSSALNAQLRRELEDRRNWLHDLMTKGFSLRGGYPAEEIRRIKEIEQLLATETAPKL